MRPPNSPPEYVPLLDSNQQHFAECLRSSLATLDKLESGASEPAYLALDGLVLVTAETAAAARERIVDTWSESYPEVFGTES